ncbi:MAG: hypothetical protein LAO56_11205 [Acidobacteriia bacterium]|nr:hypothetical protein [Terriglobia bacterium]
MLQDNESLALLDKVKYLYLRELSEPRDNSLVLVAEEAILNQSRNVEADSSLPAAVREAGILKGAHPIESTENCKIFKLYWKHYAAYLVTEELVGSNGQGYDDEVYTGGLLRHYTKSHFLEHLARDTGGHLSPVRHYKLICLNHLIDVAAYEPPEIDLVTDLPDVGRSRML